MADLSVWVIEARYRRRNSEWAVYAYGKDQRAAVFYRYKDAVAYLGTVQPGNLNMDHRIVRATLTHGGED